MHKLANLVASCAVLAAMSGAADANLILVGGDPPVQVGTVAASFTDLGAVAFGSAPRLLTLQTNGVEDGNVTPVNVVNGDAVPGLNKSTTPTLATLGWTSGAEVGIGFDFEQTGGAGITMQSLVLTIFNGTAPEGSFALAPALTPLTFTAADFALLLGNDNAVFNFGLNPAEQAQFNTIRAKAGSSGFFAGLSAQLGCPAGAPAGCLVSNDGPDTFLGFRQSDATVPEPATLALLSLGLAGLGFSRRKQ